MTKEIAEYWGKLTASVHPDDVATFRQESDHGFNLVFPPPAFVGDIVKARVIILDNNGGYDPVITPNEFPDQRAHDEYRQTLSFPRPLNPSARSTSPYYLQRNYTEWLVRGEAALVNGVGYRSVSGKDNAVDRLTKVLPSARFHQEWLRRFLCPLVERGERFVVVHRWSRWNGAADALLGLSNAVRSKLPRSPDLTSAEYLAARKFLANR